MTDYENVSPETLQIWRKEFQNRFRRELRQYLKEFPDATPDEKRDLESWVRSGHSPYDNGDYVATEYGGPMDFINARRFMEEAYLNYLNSPDSKFENMDSGDGLPF